MSELKPCRHCEGRGYFLEDDPYKDMPLTMRPIKMRDKRNCPHCLGTGKEIDYDSIKTDTIAELRADVERLRGENEQLKIDNVRLCSDNADLAGQVENIKRARD